MAQSDAMQPSRVAARERAMDIVDAQVHMGRGKIEATLEAMDALGIASLLIDELWQPTADRHPSQFDPGYHLPNGVFRATWPTAEEASLRFPERFSYIARIDRLDPQLESIMRVVGSSPHARAFRLQPVWTMAEAAAFAAGAYDPLLAIAQDIGKPVSLFIPGHVELLAPYLRRFPALTFIIDHCGIGFPGIPPDRPEAAAAPTLLPDYLEVVARLAEYPNVVLKWSHAQSRLGAARYPYPELRPLLRRMLTAFGAERVMWASDKTVMFGYRWADLLYSLRDDSELSPEEKAWLLGGTARRVLKWPAAPAA
jgi:predicted TIM-barrel fold metal-dependent hydrolase